MLMTLRTILTLLWRFAVVDTGADESRQIGRELSGPRHLDVFIVSLHQFNGTPVRSDKVKERDAW